MPLLWQGNSFAGAGWHKHTVKHVVRTPALVLPAARPAVLLVLVQAVICAREVSSTQSSRRVGEGRLGLGRGRVSSYITTASDMMSLPGSPRGGGNGIFALLTLCGNFHRRRTKGHKAASASSISRRSLVPFIVLPEEEAPLFDIVAEAGAPQSPLWLCL